MGIVLGKRRYFIARIYQHNLLKKYLVLLLENELIEYTAGERTFKTTGKGMRYLQMYAQLGQLIVKQDSRFTLSDVSRMWG